MKLSRHILGRMTFFIWTVCLLLRTRGTITCCTFPLFSPLMTPGSRWQRFWERYFLWADATWSSSSWRWTASSVPMATQSFESRTTSSMLLLPSQKAWDGVAAEKTPSIPLRRRRCWFARRNSGTLLPPARAESDSYEHEQCLMGSIAEDNNPGTVSAVRLVAATGNICLRTNQVAGWRTTFIFY